MIDLALDPSETRETRTPELRPRRVLNLRVALFGLAGAGALCGFGVAASAWMADLAAPASATFTVSEKAADWPDLKDGLPALAGSRKVTAAAAKPVEPAAPALRMAALPDSFTPSAAPAKAPVPPSPPPAKTAAAPEPPTRRIPVPVAVEPIAAGRQVVPLSPTRTATLISPRAAETVKAREPAEPAALPAPKPVAAAPVTPAASVERVEKAEKIEKAEKPARRTVATRKAPTAPKVAEKAAGAAPTAVAQADASEPEETEVLGIKLPSLAPAGRKLKESVDALGDAVKNAF